jgi:hypothetical protein
MNKMTNMAGLAVSYLSLSALKPYGNNARTHSRKQIAQVAGSIKSLGFNVPILIDEDNTVLAGHARLAAAKTLGLEAVPCVRLSHMSKAQKGGSVITNSALPPAMRREQSSPESALPHGSRCWPSITGFSVSEIDGLLEGVTVEEPGNPRDDRLPELAEVAVTRSGDLWIL